MTDQTPENGSPVEPTQPPVPPVVPDAVVPPAVPYAVVPPAVPDAVVPPVVPDAVVPPAVPDAVVPPAAAAAPDGLGGLVPPKKGMPGWAIGLIVGGGVLLLLLIAGVFVVASLFMGLRSSDSGAPAPAAPDPTFTNIEEPLDEPVDSGNSTGDITLDDSASFGSAPVWGVPMLTGWDILTFDEQGINKFQDTASGCTFMTSQNIQDIDSSSPSDKRTTQSLIGELEKSISSRADSSTVVYSKTVDLSMSITGGEPTIEFAMLRLDYSVSTGDFSSVFFARSMPASGAYMFTQLECITSVMDSSRSPLDELIDRISVSRGY